MNTFEWFVFNFLMTKLFMVSLVFGCAYGCLVPATYKSYLNWKSDPLPAKFSSLVVLGFTSVFIIFSAFPIFFTETERLQEMLPEEYNSLIVFLILGVLTSSFFLPKAYELYLKLKVSKKAKDFTAMVFLGTIALFFMSYLGVSILKSAVGLSRVGL